MKQSLDLPHTVHSTKAKDKLPAILKHGQRDWGGNALNFFAYYNLFTVTLLKAIIDSQRVAVLPSFNRIVPNFGYPLMRKREKRMTEEETICDRTYRAYERQKTKPDKPETSSLPRHSKQDHKVHEY